jgi:outer membrane protein, heavy metal efflux system
MKNRLSTNVIIMILSAVLLLGTAVDNHAQIKAEEISLDKARELFYQNNYDIIISRYEIDKSYADYVGTKLFPNPRLLLDRVGMDVSNRLANGDNTQDTIRIEQLIETGGKRGLRMNAAAATLEASKLTHRDIIRTLLIGFYTLFYNLYQDLLNYELAQGEVERFTKILDIAGKRHEAGFLTLIDYTKLKLSAIELENHLTNIENQLRNNSEYLGYLIGSGKPVRPKKVVAQTELTLFTEEGLVKTAYQNRYDLLSLERQIKAASHGIALARAMRIPDVTIGAEWEKFSPNYDTGVGLGLSFDLPVFNRRQGEILRKGAEQKQIESQFIKVKQQIVTEIRQAINNYATSFKVFDAYEKRKAEMDDLMQRTEKSFSLGGITVLDLLDTQKAYRDFQIKYHQTLTQSNLNRELINVYTGTIK